MKKKAVVSFLGILALVFSLCPEAAAQQQMRTIEIGVLSTTHLLFTSDLTYVDISSPDVIAAKVVDASKNMLAIKARKEFAFTTTVSALEANGTMHTFYVCYNVSPSVLVIDTRIPDGAGSSVSTVNTQIRPEQQEAPQGDAGVSPSSPAPKENVSRPEPKKDKKQKKDKKKAEVPGRGNGVNVTSSQTSNFGRGNAPTIEEVLHRDRELYHVMDKIYNLEASVVNIYAYSDLTYVVIDLRNNSDIGYEAGDAQFTVENKKVSGKALYTDKSIWPRSSYGTLSCPPNSSTRIGYTIPKLTLQKNEVLKIYIYEKGGARNLFLTLDDRDVNYAVSPLKR